MLIFAIYILTTVIAPDQFLSEASKALNVNAATAFDTNGLVVSSQGGRLMQNIKTLKQSLESSERVELSRARQIFVQTALDLMQCVNKNKKLRPYLNTYPFSIENIQLTIGFTENNNFIKPPHIANISCHKGKVYYSIANTNREAEPLNHLHEETFEEACQLVAKEK